MKSSKHKLPWFVVAAIAALFFVFPVRNTSAGDPVPGIDISLEEIPNGIVTKGVTGADGVARFPGLAPGTYRVVLDNVATAAENHNSSRENIKLPPAAPPAEPGSEGSGSGPSVNIGIGGIFGSGSTKRSPSERADGRGSSGNAGAGGVSGGGGIIPLFSGEVWNQPSKAKKEQAEADAAKRQEGEVGNRPTQAFNPSEIVIKKEEGVSRAPSGDVGQAVEGCGCKGCQPCLSGHGGDGRVVGGAADVVITEGLKKTQPMILWTTLVNGRTASFIPRSACDVKDGMEAALVIVSDEPQFAVRISQTPYLPQGVIIQCAGGDPLKGLNIKGSSSTGSELCP